MRTVRQAFLKLNSETKKAGEKSNQALQSLVLFIPLLIPILAVQSILDSAFRNASKARIAPPETLGFLLILWRWTEWFWPWGVMVACFGGCWFAAKSTRLGLREKGWFAIALSVLGLMLASIAYWWVDKVIHQ